jgi:hypothetical protein
MNGQSTDGITNGIQDYSVLNTGTGFWEGLQNFFNSDSGFGFMQILAIALAIFLFILLLPVFAFVFKALLFVISFVPEPRKKPRKSA